ncbi:MAG: porphobilinogen synthase [Candidatus Omnitrophota bacterium]
MAISIKTDDLICPYFVTGGKGIEERIRSFPGQFRFSIDRLAKDMDGLAGSGINKVLIFGVPAGKDGQGSFAYLKNNIVSSAVREIKKRFPRLKVMTDVCLCAYTNHGHCGILKGRDKQIDNKATLETLSRIAVAHAEAGADYVAPSAMAKGQVKAIRKALDGNGHRKTKIMGYSAKFASNFYGPFRNAAKSAPAFGDRRAYQLNYRDRKNALREIGDDIGEGADIVMVKPALSYLDIIRETRSEYSIPLAAYNVSGEYAFVKHGVRQGLWREKEIVFEIVSSIKRAGADLIITYHARDIARWLKKP